VFPVGSVTGEDRLRLSRSRGMDERAYEVPAVSRDSMPIGIGCRDSDGRWLEGRVVALWETALGIGSIPRQKALSGFVRPVIHQVGRQVCPNRY
jgi:hypothetical protein